MNQPTAISRRSPHILILALLLPLFFGLALGASMHKSPTFDEGFYIARGWAALRTGHFLPLGHPPLTNLLAGTGVLLEPGLPHPAQLDGWTEDNAERVSKDLLWERGLDTDRIVFLGRMPGLLLAVLFGALLWRWAWELYGPWSAVLAVMLFTFSPNMLAHAGLATTDLGVAAFYVAALYAWVRFLRLRTVSSLIAAGVLLGLAQSAKFSAALLAPTLILMTLWMAWRAQGLALRGRNWLARLSQQASRWPAGWFWGAVYALLVVGVLGALTIWAINFFTLRPLMPGNYLGELSHFLGLAAGGHRAYLLGMLSERGWWYYHLIALAVKLPESTILLFLLALMLAAGRHMRTREWEVVFPGMLYLAASLVISLNVGVRYLLPVILLLSLFIARIASGPPRSGMLRLAVIGILLLVNVAITLRTFPNFISYFNLVSGGSSNGYRILVDSNLDWGQDLPALADYLRETDADTVYLSYFGQAEPAYYGIDYIPLPGWPPPTPDPSRP
ncbi:MAG: glycosyltransferase family 39 protein, partial [Anaerolineae bacterium]|nr:glycosyltransferase family 39 protein [Anaerolineae bacterium]